VLSECITAFGYSCALFHFKPLSVKFIVWWSTITRFLEYWYL